MAGPERPTVQEKSTTERQSFKMAGHGGKDVTLGLWSLDYDKGRVFENSIRPAALLQAHVGTPCKIG